MKNPIVCFSHRRWHFVFQRSNHLMSHFARERRVYYVEPPVYGASTAHMKVELVRDTLMVCTPHLPTAAGGRPEVARLVRRFLTSRHVADPVLWLCTPLSLPLITDMHASAVVYDCMDELALLPGDSKQLLAHELALLERADVVFTGGHSLHESKCEKHSYMHVFPSGVDASHFAPDRQQGVVEPEDQAQLARPRIGFYGIIDERMDVELLARTARERPGYQFILVGPVAGISKATLPRADNIHYLGSKPYAELPRYLRGWDVAMMPFALNDATRSMSPTKTLEYLAGGKPVVSTAVRDVVVPYGRKGLVHVAERGNFAAALDVALAERPCSRRRAAVQEIVRASSWETIWRSMSALLEAVERRNRGAVMRMASSAQSMARAG
jgi:glycosyltransferase involved in cell wall biosynthesis